MRAGFVLRVVVLMWLLLPLNLHAAPGLKDLSDDPVRIELAKDGLGALLERAFVVDNVPDERRGPERAVIALEGLSTPGLTAQEKADRLKEIVAGIGAALPQMNDPQMLLSPAAMLVKQGVEQDVNILEYFGDEDSDATKARLQPIVASAVGLYDRAVSILDQRQSDLADRIRQPGDSIALQWQKVNQDFQTAAYTRWMLAYSYAISLDRADKKRLQVCDEAIDKLAQWDTPDSGVQPIVRLQIGKLRMLKGTRAELRRAKETFATISALSPDAGGVSPAADRFTLFNAKYFTAVCDVIGNDAAGADRDAQAADEYRKSALAGVAGDDYAMDMLHYRIALLKQDNAGAVKTLEALSEKAPGLRGAISAHLLDKLPDHPDISKLSPVMMTALVQRAWIELGRPKPDRQILNEGLAAATAYVAKADQNDPLVSPAAVMDASKIRGVILKATSRPSEAATAFIDHAQRFKSDPNSQAAQSINEAIAQISQLYQSADMDAHQADITALEQRVYPLAVDSFRRYDLAYEYARDLQRSGQAAKAAAVFDLVPADDPNKSLSLYYKEVALSQRLESDQKDLINSVSAGNVPNTVGQIEKLADQFDLAASQRQAAETDPEKKRQYQTMRAQSRLLAAQAAGRYLREAKTVIERLADFETFTDGLANQKSLLTSALNMRVSAYMIAGDPGKATETLVQYLNRVGGDEGLAAVYNLLTQLNQELSRAQSEADTSRAKELIDDRAALTPFLVKWAANNSNPDISKYTYRYRVFDAATQKQAAELETDPAARSDQLDKAMARYQDLQSAENLKLYQASLPADADAQTKDDLDPAVTLGIGEVAFAQGDWKLAHDTIGALLAESKLGDGTIVNKGTTGQTELTDNDQFWEAQYKFIYATMQLSHEAKSGVDAGTPRTILARLQAAWQDGIGGKKWHEKFDALERELKTGAGTRPGG